MRFKSLGSGSSGNATLIESAGPLPFRLLVDCGLGPRSLQSRLAAEGLRINDIQAIFITHEHSDHIGCAQALAVRCSIPVWMSRGTYSAIGEPDFKGMLRIARDGEPIRLGGLEVTPFTVPHDAREPLQLTCTDGQLKFGILTDLGHATPHVIAHLQGCHALMLEFNHDVAMLSSSTYPAFLKRRVGGRYGHLSNTAAVEIALELMHSGLRHVVASHLSLQNNCAVLVRQILQDALPQTEPAIVVASATDGTPWVQL